jgi:protein tyrosine phosphatase (PTP) superfamily phosphohydrolase (DUF442 family)
MAFSFTSSWVRKQVFVLLAALTSCTSAYAGDGLLAQSASSSASSTSSPTIGAPDVTIQQPATANPSTMDYAKQFIRSFFQNINATPQDAYVFPAEFGAVSSMDLPNFHQVEPYLYRGGAPSEAGFKILRKMGIRTVVDLRKSPDKVQTEGREVRSLGMQYVNLPVARGVPQQQYQQKFFHVVEDASKKVSDGPVFVHCDFGCDRTGYMVGMWRIQHDHWSSHDAMQEMFKYGYLIHLAGPEEPRVRSWLTKLEGQSK